MLHFIRAHQHFLTNNRFKLRILSDRQPLQWVSSVATRSGRLTRWLLELSDYSFKLEYIPGKLNDVADCLSRLLEAPPDAAWKSIEFRDYLRESHALVSDQILMSDLGETFEADFAAGRPNALHCLGGITIGQYVGCFFAHSLSFVVCDEAYVNTDLFLTVVPCLSGEDGQPCSK